MTGRFAAVLAAALLVVGVRTSAAQPVDDQAALRRAFARFIAAKEMRLDVVPDLYPGGYARISVYAKKAKLGGMLVDEVWFRLVGASLDVPALERGDLVIRETRDTALHARASIKRLEEYFQEGNPVKDIRLWSDGEYLYGRGTVPFAGAMARVYLRGFFAVGGTKDVYFYVDNLQVNGLPMLAPLIKKWENEINPILNQTDWPVTFKLRTLKMTKDSLVISSQADPEAPCHFCTGGDAATVTP
jgi:hypothetical protein